MKERNSLQYRQKVFGSKKEWLGDRDFDLGGKRVYRKDKR